MSKELEQSHERLAQAKVAIVLYGITHMGPDLRSITRAVDGFKRLLMERGSGRNILFLENASCTFERVEIHERNIKTYGPLDPYLAGVLSERAIRPTERAILALRRGIEDAHTIDNIMERHLVPPDELWEFLLYRELDALQKDKTIPKFEIKTESHPKNTAGEIKSAGEESTTYAELARLFWDDGNFDETLQASRRKDELLFSTFPSREKDIGLDIATHGNNLQVSKEGGFIYSMFGETHIDSLVRSITQQITKNSNNVAIGIVQSEYFPGSSTESIFTCLRENNPVPDILVARSELVSFIMREIINLFTKGKRLQELTYSFETYLKAAEEYAGTLSLEEIRRICEEKQEIPLLSGVN